MYGDITINGKRYTYSTFFRSRADAKGWVEGHKMLGYKCKIIVAKNKKGEKIFKVYTTRD